jgi:hypothetical protein
MPREDITIDVSSLNKIAKGLSQFQKEIPGAVASSLNRTLNFMNTRIGKLVTAEYAVKEKDVKATIKIEPASKGDMKAGLRSTGHTLSFAHFPYTPKSLRRGTVKVTIKRANGKKAFPHGFIAPTGAKSADKVQFNVWERMGTFKIAEKGKHAGELREQIAPIRTLSVPQMIQSVNVGNAIQEEASRKLEERISHEIEYRLNKLKSK